MEMRYFEHCEQWLPCFKLCRTTTPHCSFDIFSLSAIQVSELTKTETTVPTIILTTPQLHFYIPYTAPALTPSSPTTASMAPRVLTENAVLTHPGSATVYIFALIILPLPNPYIGIRLQTPIFVYSASDGTVNLVSVSDPKGKQALTHSSATGPIRTGTSALIPIKMREKGSTGTYASCKSGFVTGGRDGKVQVWAVEGSAGVPEGGYQVGLAGEVATRESSFFCFLGFG